MYKYNGTITTNTLSMIRKLFYILVALTLNLNVVTGNNENLSIEFFSYKDGLTTSTVHNVYKDTKGFIWICTENGLFKYDGYNFKNLNSIISSQLNSTVFCISEDDKQNLWIGTSGNGVYILENKTNKLVHLNLDFEDNVNVNQILFLKGKVWLASSIGIVIINQKENYNSEDEIEFELLLPSKLSLQDKRINCLYYMGGNHLWVGTNSILYEYNLKIGKFSPVYSDRQNSIRWLSSYENKVVAASWDGGIFLADTAALIKTSSPLTDYANSIIGDQRVKTVFTDKNGKLYVATYGEGLFVFKSENGKFSHINFRNDKNIAENIKSNTINQMYLDSTGILWLCMNQPALTKIFYHEDNISFYNPSGSNKNISEITSVHQSIDKNKLWIASNGNGIYLFDTKTKLSLQLSSKNTSTIRLDNDFISMCYQDSRGNMWIVYKRNGLYIIPGNKARSVMEGIKSSFEPIDANALLSSDNRFSSYITKFYEDSKGRIWIGLWGSLFVIKTDEAFADAQNTSNLISSSTVKCIYSDDFKSDKKLPIFPVLSMCEIQDNEYWVGTLGGGIFSFKESTDLHFTGKFSDINKSLPQLNVRCILKDKNNGIWIGTNGGLIYFNLSSKKLQIIKKSDGLPSDDINNIVQAKNSNIWVSSYYGAAEFNPHDLSFQNYLSTKKEELNQYIINAGYADPEGLIWLGTSEAIVSIKPYSKNEATGNLPLYFTDLKIDNTAVKPGEKINGTTVISSSINESEKIIVPYNHTFTIEFAELNYKNPEHVLYKYKLGENKEWINQNSNQRNINFSNMKPGEYQLEIMSSNSGIENIKRLKIIFQPPYWRSKLAYLIYFTIIIVLVLIYRKITIQKILQRNEIENERYQRIKLEELDKMKSEFFSNISHEFRTPLSLIINPLEILAKDSETPGKNKEKIDLVLKSSKRLLKLTNELMDFSKIEKKSLIPYFQETEFISFTKEIFKLFENFADINHIDYKFNNSTDQVIIPIDRNMTEKVIFNLLSNAFKYTPKNGTILLDINVNTEFLKVSIINSGEGIAHENIEKVFDRYYQVNNVQNRKVEGTGIGLSLVKNYIELQSGKVNVVSDSGTDTTFSFYLPLTQNNAVKEDISAPYSPYEENEDLKINHKEIKLKSNYHILIVEDEDDLRNFIISELETDFKVSNATNGEEGIKLANELIPDIIITDVMMPVMNGIDLCNTLKNQMSTSHIPIIILSAKTKIAEQIEGLEMGADVYMVKPFNMEHLKVQIVRLVQFKEKLYSRYLKENSIIPEGALITKLDEEFMNKIVAFLDSNLSNTNLAVEDLAHCVGLSKVQAYRKVKAITGLTVVEFIRAIRLKKAARLVVERKMSFSEISFETGFSSPSYFTRCFHDHFGKSPSEYANENSKSE